MNTEAPIYKYLCCILVIALVGTSSPMLAFGATLGIKGAETAGEAASAAGMLTNDAFSSRNKETYFAASQPDTSSGTGIVLEEEEQDHLIRDVGVFVIVSVFVGYFIIKVFLEGETEEIPPDDGGKGVPNPFSMKLTY